ncbi:MAG: quinol:cytochrome C oxidoreductase [Ignavibacteriales bacterium CG_4_9_14_3_um_filter_30_11]|nr:MAG: quinol:cytochrome C oxidoreductase [Ignavibacteriales bacterium CG_4_9_14_3_um_filter_30_11]
MANNDSGYIKKVLPSKIGKIGLILFIIGAVTGLYGYIFDPSRAVFSYLTSFWFLLSIAVGSLLLVAIEYAASATWSTPFRRMSEFLASSIPLLIILVIPLLLSIQYLFVWSHTDVVANDHMLQAKSVFLNTPFFSVRVIVILLIWSLFYYLIIRNSRQQDNSGDQALTKNNIKLSIIFIPLFAISLTLQSIDWIMSLETKWFSTMFGVYLFAGATCSALAALAFISVLLKEKGYFHPKITKDHFYSLGTLMFVFICFWGYIAFSQYMLIWYGNLPEETFWFMQRWEGGWKFVSLFIIFGHFIVPFATLLSHPSKTNLKKLKFISIWILAMHFIDLYWLIMPSMHGNGLHYSFSWMDISFLAASVGIIIFMFNKMFERYNLIPVKDPKLQRGLDFHL